jgi:HNH endonuclease
MREDITSRIRRLVWGKTDGHCWYCGDELHPFGDYKNPHRNLHIDHLIAVSNGGPTELKNLVPACQNSNRRKSTKSLEQFRQLCAWQIAYFDSFKIDGELQVPPLTFFGEKLEAERKAIAKARRAQLSFDFEAASNRFITELFQFLR